MMNSGRILLGGNLSDPTPPNVYEDLRWLHLHRDELLETYGEVVVLIHQGRVIGIGETVDEAVARAEKEIPTDTDPITPIIGVLRRENDILGRLRASGKL